MSQLLSDNWYIFVLIGTGVLGLWFGLSVLGQRSDNHTPRKWSLIWGPFAPAIGSYLLKRGGFTKREKLGWLFVAFLMLAVFVSAFFIEY